jgi:hypothetical protein
MASSPTASSHQNADDTCSTALVVCTCNLHVHGRCWGATLTLVAAEKTACDFDFTLNRHVQLLLTSVYMYVHLNGKHIKFPVRAY